MGATADAVTSSFLVEREDGFPTVVGDGTSAYLHAGGLPESVTGTQSSFALTDRLGSIRGYSDGGGALVGSASYEAFGTPRVVSGTQGLFGFTGEPTDSTGLVYLRSRYLDPFSGRLLSADTVSPNAPGTQGYSLYAYAANNPTTWTDPTGHWSQLAGVVLSGLRFAPTIPTLPFVLIIVAAMVVTTLFFICALTAFCLADVRTGLAARGLAPSDSPELR